MNIPFKLTVNENRSGQFHLHLCPNIILFAQIFNIILQILRKYILELDISWIFYWSWLSMKKNRSCQFHLHLCPNIILVAQIFDIRIQLLRKYISNISWIFHLNLNIPLESWLSMKNRSCQFHLHFCPNIILFAQIFNIQIQISR